MFANLQFNSNSDIIKCIYHSRHKGSLISIIAKSVKNSNIEYNNYRHIFKIIDNVIKTNIKRNNSDLLIITELKKLNKKKKSVYNSFYNKKRAINKWEIIKNYKPSKINSLLDFGGNVGDHARVWGDILKLGKKDIFVVDIDEWEGEKWVPRKDITFTHFNDISKLTNNSIDMINFSHVLHHIKSSDHTKIVKMCENVLSNNGFIIIYEHDVIGDLWKLLVDLEHLIFDVVVTGRKYEEFTNSFYSNYHQMDYWANLFSDKFKVFAKYDAKTRDRSKYIFLKHK